MLEIDRLSEITFDSFEKAIKKTISNKIFIRNNIVEMPDLTKEDQLNTIHEVFFTRATYTLIKTVNNIEWTPVKLYLTGYYIVNLYNKYWMVSHNIHEGFVVKYKITHQKYIDIIFLMALDSDVEYLHEMYRCSKHDILYAVKNIKEHIAFIKQTTFLNSDVIINHYVYKKDGKIYYLQFSNFNAYKPYIYM
jgi:hypothetical protein